MAMWGGWVSLHNAKGVVKNASILVAWRRLQKATAIGIFCSIRVRLSSFFGSYLLPFVGDIGRLIIYVWHGHVRGLGQPSLCQRSHKKCFNTWRVETHTKGNRNSKFWSIGWGRLRFLGHIFFILGGKWSFFACARLGGSQLWMCGWVKGPQSFDNRFRKVYMSKTATAIQIFA